MRESHPQGENWKNPEQRLKLLDIPGLFEAIQDFFVHPSGRVKVNTVFDEKGEPLWPGQADIKSPNDVDVWIERKSPRSQKLLLKVNVPIVEMYAKKWGRTPRQARYEWRFEIDKQGIVTFSMTAGEIFPGFYQSDDRSFNLSSLIREMLERN